MEHQLFEQMINKKTQKSENECNSNTVGGLARNMPGCNPNMYTQGLGVGNTIQQNIYLHCGPENIYYKAMMEYLNMQKCYIGQLIQNANFLQNLQFQISQGNMMGGPLQFTGTHVYNSEKIEKQVVNNNSGNTPKNSPYSVETLPAERIKTIKTIKKFKKITECPHPERKHYAKNMCSNCYHSKGRAKRAWKCNHSNKFHYAHGLCQNCYQLNYCQKRKENEEKGNSQEWNESNHLIESSEFKGIQKPLEKNSANEPTVAENVIPVNQEVEFKLNSNINVHVKNNYALGLY